MLDGPGTASPRGVSLPGVCLVVFCSSCKRSPSQVTGWVVVAGEGVVVGGTGPAPSWAGI